MSIRVWNRIGHCPWRRFTEPEPYFDGPLTEAEVSAGLADAVQRAYEAPGAPAVTGLLSLRLEVAPRATLPGS